MLACNDKDAQAQRNGCRVVLFQLRPLQRAMMLNALSGDPGFIRILRRQIRADALREMIELAPQHAICAKAEWVADQLVSYASLHWPRDRANGLSNTTGELRLLQYQVLSANDGEPLGWRRILDIVRARRSRDGGF